jgi:hypothetical protein
MTFRVYCCQAGRFAGELSELDYVQTAARYSATNLRASSSRPEL